VFVVHYLSEAEIADIALASPTLDLTTNLQAAIDVSDDTGRPLHWPKGRLRATTLYKRSAAPWQGAGYRLTELREIDAETDLLVLEDAAGASELRNPVFRDMSFVGPSITLGDVPGTPSDIL